MDPSFLSEATNAYLEGENTFIKIILMHIKLAYFSSETLLKIYL